MEMDHTKVQPGVLLQHRYRQKQSKTINSEMKHIPCVENILKAKKDREDNPNRKKEPAVTIPWFKDLYDRMRKCLKKNTNKEILDILSDLLRFVRRERTCGYPNPPSGRILTRKVPQFMFLLRNLNEDYNDSEEFLIKMADVLVIYTELELKFAKLLQRSQTVVAQRISKTYDLLFNKAEDNIYIIRILLQAAHIYEQNEVMRILLQKYLKFKGQRTELPDTAYMINLMAFKKWVDLEQDKFEVKRIIEQANNSIKPRTLLRYESNNSLFMSILQLEGVTDDKMTLHVLNKSYDESIQKLVTNILARMKTSTETIPIIDLVEDDLPSENTSEDELNISNDIASLEITNVNRQIKSEMPDVDVVDLTDEIQNLNDSDLQWLNILVEKVNAFFKSAIIAKNITESDIICLDDEEELIEQCRESCANLNIGQDTQVESELDRIDDVNTTECVAEKKDEAMQLDEPCNELNVQCENNTEKSGDLQNNIEKSEELQNNIENSGDLQNNIEKSGDLQNNIEKSGDLQNNIEKSGDLQINIEKSGDLQNNIEKSGDLQNNIEQSGDLQNNIEKSGDLQNNIDVSLVNNECNDRNMELTLTKDKTTTNINAISESETMNISSQCTENVDTFSHTKLTDNNENEITSENQEVLKKTEVSDKCPTNENLSDNNVSEKKQIDQNVHHTSNQESECNKSKIMENKCSNIRETDSSELEQSNLDEENSFTGVQVNNNNLTESTIFTEKPLDAQNTSKVIENNTEIFRLTESSIDVNLESDSINFLSKKVILPPLRTYERKNKCKIQNSSNLRMTENDLDPTILNTLPSRIETESELSPTVHVLNENANTETINVNNSNLLIPLMDAKDDLTYERPLDDTIVFSASVCGKLEEKQWNDPLDSQLSMNSTSSIIFSTAKAVPQSKELNETASISKMQMNQLPATDLNSAIISEESEDLRSPAVESFSESDADELCQLIGKNLEKSKFKNIVMHKTVDRSYNDDNINENNNLCNLKNINLQYDAETKKHIENKIPSDLLPITIQKRKSVSFADMTQERASPVINLINSLPHPLILDRKSYDGGSLENSHQILGLSTNKYSNQHQENSNYYKLSINQQTTSQQLDTSINSGTSHKILTAQNTESGSNTLAEISVNKKHETFIKDKNELNINKNLNNSTVQNKKNKYSIKNVAIKRSGQTKVDNSFKSRNASSFYNTSKIASDFDRYLEKKIIYKNNNFKEISQRKDDKVFKRKSIRNEELKKKNISMTSVSDKNLLESFKDKKLLKKSFVKLKPLETSCLSFFVSDTNEPKSERSKRYFNKSFQVKTLVHSTIDRKLKHIISSEILVQVYKRKNPTQSDNENRHAFIKLKRVKHTSSNLHNNEFDNECENVENQHNTLNKEKECRLHFQTNVIDNRTFFNNSEEHKISNAEESLQYESENSIGSRNESVDNFTISRTNSPTLSFNHISKNHQNEHKKISNNFRIDKEKEISSNQDTNSVLISNIQNNDQVDSSVINLTFLESGQILTRSNNVKSLVNRRVTISHDLKEFQSSFYIDKVGDPPTTAILRTEKEKIYKKRGRPIKYKKNLTANDVSTVGTVLKIGNLYKFKDGTFEKNNTHFSSTPVTDNKCLNNSKDVLYVSENYIFNPKNAKTYSRNSYVQNIFVPPEIEEIIEDTKEYKKNYR